MADDTGWKVVESLTTEIGPRMAGSEADLKAVAWAQAKFKALGFELDVIAACFIGGTSMRGGSGTVYGALLGALVITSLDNGMSMLDVDSYWQMIVKGSILVLAVWVDVSTRTGRR